jgi:hypothetical protein
MLNRKRESTIHRMPSILLVRVSPQPEGKRGIDSSFRAKR